MYLFTMIYPYMNRYKCIHLDFCGHVYVSWWNMFYHCLIDSYESVFTHCGSQMLLLAHIKHKKKVREVECFWRAP